ncbi:MAG: TetR/AcrR family transcriptional regulator [Cryomorphaceae bacterium]|nr:TetR/AcrR family transcriptional regulator [Cryomorphaceae bacterium]
MEELFKGIRIDVDANIYVKDPYSSDIGKLIVGKGIDVLLELGLESFTFKKLSEQIGTTEASIYRYFENKHKLLLYINAWYWGWMEYNLMFMLSNVESPEDQLERSLDLLVNGSKVTRHDMIDVIKLQDLIVEESVKAYFTKEVNEEYKKGFFQRFHRFVKRITDIISNLNPKFPYPNSLSTSLIDSIHQQKYYQRHLPFLSDLSKEKENGMEFYRRFVHGQLCYQPNISDVKLKTKS